MASFETALKAPSSVRAKVADYAGFSAAEESRKLNQQVKGIVRSSQFRRDIADYITTLQTNPHDIRSLEDIINFTKTFPAESYPEHDIAKFLWTRAEEIDVDSNKH